MSQSISDLLRSSGALDPQPKRTAESVAHPVKICVCGHPERKHSPDIGGSAPIPARTPLRTTLMPGCVGENRARNVDAQELVGVVPDEDSPNGKHATLRIIATCPCPEFRPVLTVKDPRFCFLQKRPTTRPRSGIRDLSPARHPLMVGLRGIRTSTVKRREIAELRDMGAPGDAIEARIDELMEARIKYLPEWKCFTRGCKRTDVVPVFVNAEDLSELRCSSHLPEGAR